MPEVRITDAAAASAPDVAIIAITDRSGAMEALRAGAAAVLSQRTDGEGLHAAIRAAAEGLTTLAGEYRDLLVDGRDAAGGLEWESRSENALCISSQFVEPRQRTSITYRKPSANLNSR